MSSGVMVCLGARSPMTGLMSIWGAGSSGIRATEASMLLTAASTASSEAGAAWAAVFPLRKSSWRWQRARASSRKRARDSFASLRRASSRRVSLLSRQAAGRGGLGLGHDLVRPRAGLRLYLGGELLRGEQGHAHRVFAGAVFLYLVHQDLHLGLQRRALALGGFQLGGHLLHEVVHAAHVVAAEDGLLKDFLPDVLRSHVGIPFPVLNSVL